MKNLKQILKENIVKCCKKNKPSEEGRCKKSSKKNQESQEEMRALKYQTSDRKQIRSK